MYASLHVFTCVHMLIRLSVFMETSMYVYVRVFFISPMFSISGLLSRKANNKSSEFPRLIRKQQTPFIAVPSRGWIAHLVPILSSLRWTVFVQLPLPARALVI